MSRVAGDRGAIVVQSEVNRDLGALVHRVNELPRSTATITESPSQQSKSLGEAVTVEVFCPLIDDLERLGDVSIRERRLFGLRKQRVFSGRHFGLVGCIKKRPHKCRRIAFFRRCILVLKCGPREVGRLLNGRRGRHRKPVLGDASRHKETTDAGGHGDPGDGAGLASDGRQRHDLELYTRTDNDTPPRVLYHPTKRPSRLLRSILVRGSPCEGCRKSRIPVL